MLSEALPPLVIQFAAGSSLEREQDRPSQLPIYRNGPPGTFVRLDGLWVAAVHENGCQIWPADTAHLSSPSSHP